MKALTSNMTMEKLAEIAGVSLATVSRVFNDSDKVTEATKRKVRDLAEKYDFHPNETARTMAAGKSKLISVVLPDIANPYFSKLLEHLGKLSVESGYTIVFYNSDGDSEVEQNIVKKMIARQADGLLIAMTKIDSKTIPLLKKAPFPVVVMCSNVEGLDSVGIDHVKGGMLAARHLLKQGMKRFCYFGIDADKKYVGFKKELLANGVSEENILIIGNQDWYVKSIEDGKKVLADFVADGCRSGTGFFCINDYYAACALSLVKEKGFSVPEEISIVGFDDTLVSEVTDPPLTTLHQALERIAKRGFSVLLERINGKTAPEKTESMVFDPEIIVRGT